MSNTDGNGAQQQDRVNHDEYQLEADGLMAGQEVRRKPSDGGDDITAREAFGPLVVFLLSTVPGCLTALVLVYGTIDPAITFHSVLMFPLVLLAMILTVPAWGLVYLAIASIVKWALGAVLRVIP